LTLILGIFTFFVVLAVLILVHEFGHFSFAKLSGVRVEEFGLGFPPRLRAWQRRGTVYSLNAIPIGGFVRMLGENGEDAEPDSFGAQPPWRRLIILAAGPTMNILLALTILFVAFMVGSPRSLTVVTGVSRHSPAAAAGLRSGDRIVQLDGRPVRYLEDLQAATLTHSGERVTLTVQRGSRTFRTSLVPRKHPPRDQGPMGVALERTVVVTYSPGKAAQMSLQAVGTMVTGIPAVLQSLSEHGTRGVAGPVGIANLTTHVVQHEPQQGPGSLLQFVALLSANLGVLNLLPIPALDGGRIVFVLISWIRRRNLDPEVEGLIHMVGMAVLLFLIAVISYQDLVRWITGGSF
jgi:regulator of sigma E protease